MSVLPLVQITKEQIPNKVPPLRTPSGIVTDFGDEFQKIVDDIIETFMSHRIAVGLAAPQVGIQLKVSVININKDKTGDIFILVNPVILSTSGKKDKKKESCMSIPHYAGEVERRDKISISYQDRFGVEHSLNTDGFLARVIAHEVDHLEGFLYVDRMSDITALEPTDIFKND